MDDTITRTSSHLTAAQLSELKTDLERELKRLGRSIAPEAAGSRKGEAPWAADLQLGQAWDTTSTADGGVAGALEGRAMTLYLAVIDALERMKNGTYGICAGCQRDIPYGRLMAMPETTQCVACGARG